MAALLMQFPTIDTYSSHFIQFCREKATTTQQQEEMLPRDGLVRVWKAKVILLLATTTSLSLIETIEGQLDNHGKTS